MKVKRKGKVYPSSSSPLPSSSITSSFKDPDSVLKLLPVTVLALALSLPNQDREVLAYLIARSIITTTANPSSLVNHQHPKSKYTTKKNDKSAQKFHLFECGCFDCYIRFWFRWDSSPNRDFIHQVIEAFEEHLVQNESLKKHSRGKKRCKVMVGRFESDISVSKPEKESEISVPGAECQMLSPENAEGEDMEENNIVCEEEEGERMGEVTGNLEMDMVTVQAARINHKGLARKVLPDLVGLLNSRLWSLWILGI